MKARIAFVLLAWIATFVIVSILFLILGGWLQALPLLARAAVVSGILVVTMTQLVMPFLTRRYGPR